MNTSPWLEIIVAVASIAFVGTLLGIYIYRRAHNLPTGDCKACKSHNALKEYRKMYPKCDGKCKCKE